MPHYIVRETFTAKHLIEANTPEEAIEKTQERSFKEFDEVDQDAPVSKLEVSLDPDRNEEAALERRITAAELDVDEPKLGSDHSEAAPRTPEPTLVEHLLSSNNSALHRIGRLINRLKIKRGMRHGVNRDFYE